MELEWPKRDNIPGGSLESLREAVLTGVRKYLPLPEDDTFTVDILRIDAISPAASACGVRIVWYSEPNDEAWSCGSAQWATFHIWPSKVVPSVVVLAMQCHVDTLVAVADQLLDTVCTLWADTATLDRSVGAGSPISPWWVDHSQRGWGSDALCTVNHTTVIPWMAEQREQRSNHPALVSPWERIEWTYSELFDRVAGHAARLRSTLGVLRGGVVAVLVEEGAPLVVAMLAAVYAGATVVPIHPKDPSPRVREMIRETAAGVAIVPRGSPLADSTLLSVPIVHAEDMIHVLEGCPPSAMSTCPTDICHIMYTSGSTGVPKGVVVEHSCMAHYVAQKIRTTPMDSTSRVLCASPLTFDPFLGEVLATLCAGGCVCVAPRHIIAGDIVAALQATAATHLLATPAMFTSCDREPADIPNLRVLQFGGEPMPTALIRRWGGSDWCALQNVYGVTEACVYQAYHLFTSTTPPRCIGRPYPGLGVWVLDSHLRPVRQGVVGQLVIVGPQIPCGGYLHRPDLTALRFVDLPPKLRDLVGRGGKAYLTGDLGRWVEGGVLEMLGRADHQVKIRGMRVELGEIESAIQCVGITRECVATVSGGRVVLYVVPQETIDNGGTRVPREWSAYHSQRTSGESSPWYITLTMDDPLVVALQLHASQQLPTHMMPSLVVAVTHIPLSPNGKVDRRSLPPAVPRSHTPDATPNHTHTPSDPMESLLATTWAKHLGLPLVRPSDDYFRLGGDSLGALRVTRSLCHSIRQRCDAHLLGNPTLLALRDEYGTPPPTLEVTNLMARPVLRDYAAYLTGNGWVVHVEEKSLEEEAPCESFVELDDDLLSLAEASEAYPDVRSAEELALLQASGSGRLGVVSALLGMRVDPNGGVSRQVGRKATAPLHAAAGNDRSDVIRLLLRHGAIPQLPTASGLLPIQLAAQRGTQALCVLMDQAVGIPLKVRDGNQQSLLHHAARSGNVPGLERLLGATPAIPLNWRDRWKRTPVHWAVLNNHPDALRCLLAAGAVVDARVGGKTSNRTHLKEETPLDIARRVHGPGSTVEALLVAALGGVDVAGDGPL